MEQKNQKKLKIMDKIVFAAFANRKMHSQSKSYSQNIRNQPMLHLDKQTLMGGHPFQYSHGDRRSPFPAFAGCPTQSNKLSKANSSVFSYVQSSETQLIHRFINFLTKKGQKATAEAIFSKTLYLLTKRASEDDLWATGSLFRSHPKSKVSRNLMSEDQLLSTSHFQENEKLKMDLPYGQVLSKKNSIFTLFHQSINNVKPLFEVKKVRVAGTTYQVPALIESNRQEHLAINWLIQSAYERKKKNPSQNFENCLAFELYEAFQKQGQARNKRNELHKLAEANRAFSHFRWW
jgi:small subunit ribosomal protein S7